MIPRNAPDTAEVYRRISTVVEGEQHFELVNVARILGMFTPGDSGGVAERIEAERSGSTASSAASFRTWAGRADPEETNFVITSAGERVEVEVGVVVGDQLVTDDGRRWEVTALFAARDGTRLTLSLL